MDAPVLEEPGTFSDTTILIPARNEADVIAPTLTAAAEQGMGVRIILVDDRSMDDTVSKAQRLALRNLRIITSDTLPSGWTGKLWALEQGRKHVETEYLLLLDADIILALGTLAALRAKMDREDTQFVSLLAELSMEGFWGKLLLPAFVYFFKLLYPFRLANSGTGLVAAAAGGCILTRSRMIHSIGGFGSIKHALIDDCALARRVKSRGARTWIALTHSAHCAPCSNFDNDMEHGGAHRFCATALLKRVAAALHRCLGPRVFGSGDRGRAFPTGDFGDLCCDGASHVMHLLTGIALLPNPLLLGAKPSFGRGLFHGHDMDLSTPALAGPRGYMERTKLP